MRALSDRQRAELQRWWRRAREFHRGNPRWPYTFKAFDEWVADVLKIEVKAAGGTAHLRFPGADYRVDMLWDYDPASREHVSRERRLVAETEFPSVPWDMDGHYANHFHAYRAAFLVQLLPAKELEKFGKTVPRKRPKPGQPPDTDFYRRLLAVHRQLDLERHPAPAKEIAERMGENPSTVRWWLKRARNLEKK